MKLTHNELITVGAKWLRKHRENIVIPNCTVVLSDLATIHVGRPDILGFSSDKSVLIEVKTSRSDFIAEKRKPTRKIPHLEVGELRYYLCTSGLIDTEDLPTNWGLLWYDSANGEIKIVQEARVDRCNLTAERAMLVSLLRRNKIKGN